MEIAQRLHRIFGADATRSTDHDGASGTALRVTSGSNTFFVKFGPLARAEHLRLRWLACRVRVPEVVAFDGLVLVLADLGESSLHDASAADAGAILGRVLRTLHELPTAECPFDGRLSVMLERAEDNVRTAWWTLTTSMPTTWG